MKSKTINLKLPNNLKIKIDIRDVVPIIVNCNLKQAEIYKISEAGINIVENQLKIIQLSQLGYTGAKIIKLITEHKQTKPE